MVRAGVPTIAFSSSCAVYGEPAKTPIAEGTPTAVNPYGFTKLVCERMMEDFGRAYGLRSARLRYFNAAGADPTGEIGEDHEPETHLIPLVLDAALGRKASVGIFGTDIHARWNGYSRLCPRRRSRASPCPGAGIFAEGR